MQRKCQTSAQRVTLLKTMPLLFERNVDAQVTETQRVPQWMKTKSMCRQSRLECICVAVLRSREPSLYLECGEDGQHASEAGRTNPRSLKSIPGTQTPTFSDVRVKGERQARLSLKVVRLAGVEQDATRSSFD